MGEQKQAVGRNCPIADRLIPRGKAAERQISDKAYDSERRHIENAFSRLKDFRCVATAHDRLARIASVCLVRRPCMVDV
jgi:hypothetical protein